ncbi:MAG: alpha-amylase family glycosyl hydrolase [Sandaracinaceae bacterium]
MLAACDDGAPGDAGVDAGGLDAARPDAGPPPPFVEDPRWFRHAAFYELWVRSFQDSDGDGIGDLPGLTSRLDYFTELGVEGLWLMPTFPSPLADSGYDVADYEGVHPDYGTLDDMTTFLDEAHARGLHVYLDLVFNHTSLAHPWFEDSRTDPSGAHGDWYVWSPTEGLACDGASGPFGDVRWTMDAVRGQYYFHQFYPAQPDLNFDQPAMRDALLDVMRFWLDRGVDGFRLDVPYRYDEDLPICVHRPGTFAFLRDMRTVTDSYDAAMVGEILATPEQLAAYLEPDVLQMGFLLAEATQFWIAASTGNAGALVGSFTDVAEATAVNGAGAGTFATVLGNHDLPRASDAVSGDDTALRLMAAAQFGLPGVPFVYYGEELGMLSGTDVIVDGRDSARTPMQWDATATAGFTTGTPFLGLAAEHATRNVETLRAGTDTIFQHYQRLIALRRTTGALSTGTYEPMRGPSPRVMMHWRRHPDGDRLVVVNFGSMATDLSVAVPEGWTSAHDEIAEAPVGAIAGGTLTASIPATTAWYLAP